MSKSTTREIFVTSKNTNKSRLLKWISVILIIIALLLMGFKSFAYFSGITADTNTEIDTSSAIEVSSSSDFASAEETAPVESTSETTEKATESDTSEEATECASELSSEPEENSIIKMARSSSQIAEESDSETTKSTTQVKKAPETTKAKQTGEIKRTASVKQVYIDRVFTVNSIKVDATGSSMSNEDLLYMKEVIKSLPKLFVSTDCKAIYFVDRITVNGAVEDATGLTDYQNIWIETESQSRIDMKSTLYHEVGHFIDDRIDTRYGLFSDSDVWKKAIAKEGSKICAFYADGRLLKEKSDNNRRLEGFAEAYEAFYLGAINGKPFNLQKECPEIYKILKERLTTSYVVTIQGVREELFFKDIDSLKEWLQSNISSEEKVQEIADKCAKASVGSYFAIGYGFSVDKRA